MKIKWKTKLWHEGSGSLVARENVLCMHELGSNVCIEDIGNQESCSFTNNPHKKKLLKILSNKNFSQSDFCNLRCSAPEPSNQELVEGIWDVEQSASLNMMYITLPYGFLPNSACAETGNRLIDTFLCPSNHIKNTLMEVGFEEQKIAVAPHGFDPLIFNPNGEKHALKTNKKFKFLHISIPFVICKGIDLLLQAYFLAFSDKDDVVLVIQTWDRDGKANKVIEAIKKYRRLTNSNAEVTLINDMFSQEKLADLYRACDCYVQTSRVEGFGLPVLEAMASSLAIISIDVGGHMEFCNAANSYLVPHNAVPTPPDAEQGLKSIPLWYEVDIGCLKDKMLHCYEEPHKAKEVGNIGKKHVSKHFTWKHSALRIQKIIDRRA